MLIHSSRISLGSVGLLLAACAVAISGCGPKKSEPSGMSVLAGRPGVEVFVWTAALSEIELIGVVESHGKPATLSDEAREALAFAGMSMYSVPREHIATLRGEALSPARTEEPTLADQPGDEPEDEPTEQTFAEPIIRPAVGVENVLFCDAGSAWREIASSPLTQGQSVVRRSGRTESVQRGRHSLLLRCWAMPLDEIESSGTWSATLRVEVVPQHVPADRQPMLTLEPVQPTDPAQRGELYAESGFSFDTEGAEAFVILLDRAALARLDPARAQGARNSVLWPRYADAPSVGQILLDLRDNAGRSTPRVVVLIPHVPAEYSLIPRG